MFKNIMIIGNYKIKIIKTISQGAYGFVYLVEDKNKKKMALKKMIVQNQERYNLANKELNFLQKNSKYENPNFIQYYDSKIEKFKKHHIFYILVEYGENGTLFDLISSKDSKNKKLKENEILQIIKLTNQSILALHNKSILHCDIKIENLLFFTYNKIKLCDFGSVNRYNFYLKNLTKSKKSEICEEIEKQTTFMYRPPEMCDIFTNYKITTKVDMWMLGCVIYTLMFFKHPFVESSKNGIINASFFWNKKNFYSEKLENLVRNLLTPDPKLRLSSEKVNNILKNWLKIDFLELNIMAKKIKLEQERRFVIKKRVVVEDDVFDFSGLNKIGRGERGGGGGGGILGNGGNFGERFDLFEIGVEKSKGNFNDNFDVFEKFDKLPLKKNVTFKKNNLNFFPNLKKLKFQQKKGISVNKQKNLSNYNSRNKNNFHNKNNYYSNNKKNNNFCYNNFNQNLQNKNFKQKYKQNFNQNYKQKIFNQNYKQKIFNQNYNKNQEENFLSINENVKNQNFGFNLNRSSSENNLKKKIFEQKKKKILYFDEKSNKLKNGKISEFKRNFQKNNPLQNNPDFLSF